METRESILNTTKMNLGLTPDYTPFDLMIITYINATFSTLQQLGVGPVDGFVVVDENSKWEEFVIPDDPGPQIEAVKTYIALKVKMLFDPPTTSFVLDALKNQVQELEWRMNVRRESTEWVDPLV